MSKCIDKYIKGYIIISVIYIFASHFKVFSGLINTNVVYLLISGMFLAYYFYYNYKNQSIEGIDKLLILTIGYFLITNIVFSILNGSISIEGVKYFSFFTVIAFVGIFLRKNKGWSETFLKLTGICALIHSIFIILHAAFPNVILAYNKLIQMPEVYNLIKFAAGNNYYSGITIGPASAGLFATVLVGLVLVNIYVHKKINLKNISCLIIGIVALFLSQKRSMLIASLVAIFIIFCLLIKLKSTKKEFMTKVLVFIGVVILTFGVMYIFPQTRNIIERIFNNDRFLSGREPLYLQLLEWISLNPIFGVGLGASETMFGYGGHNIYLQMLAESGLVGFILFFSYLIGLFILNFKMFYNSKKLSCELLFVIFIQIVLLIYGLTGNPIYDYSYLLLFTLIMSIPSSLKSEESKND